MDKQCLDLITKMNEKETSVTEIIDGFVNYKLNRYKTRLDTVVRKIKGEVICDSEIL